MEFPFFHVQNKELLFFQTQWAYKGTTLYPAFERVVQQCWTPHSHGICNTKRCQLRDANLVSVCSTFVLEQIQLEFVGIRGSIAFWW